MEQRLFLRSLERAIAQIDVEPFNGKRVFLDLTALTADQIYARTYVEAELRQRGVQIVRDASESEVRIQMMAPGWVSTRARRSSGCQRPWCRCRAFRSPRSRCSSGPATGD
jgi:hypothetical protein